MAAPNVTGPALRGYSIQRTGAFIDSYYDEGTRTRLYDGVPAEVREALAHMEPAEWYPRDYSVALLRGIVAVKNDAERSYEDLVACGAFVAGEATNTFLRLLMKILTPTMFFKKIPEFWARDTKGCGRFEADLSDAGEGRLQMRFLEAEGFDHMCISSIGWIRYSLEAMGKQNVEIAQTGWSLTNPSPSVVHYEVKWT